MLKKKKIVMEEGIVPRKWKRCHVIFKKGEKILLKEGIVPRKWKKTVIVPIFKKGDRGNCTLD